MHPWIPSSSWSLHFTWSCFEHLRPRRTKGTFLLFFSSLFLGYMRYSSLWSRYYLRCSSFDWWPTMSKMMRQNFFWLSTKLAACLCIYCSQCYAQYYSVFCDRCFCIDIQGMMKSKVTKPYSPHIDGPSVDLTTKEGGYPWSPQQTPGSAPVSSTFGSSTNH